MKFKKNIFSFFIILIMLTSLSLPVLGSGFEDRTGRVVEANETDYDIETTADNMTIKTDNMTIIINDVKIVKNNTSVDVEDADAESVIKEVFNAIRNAFSRRR